MITTRPVNEQDKSPWSRRARSIPAMLGATTVGIIELPFLAVGAVIIDLARGRWKLPTVRVALFVLHYAVNDSVEILLAPLLWLLAGFGTRQSSEASRRRYVHVQNVSLRVLACRAEQLLGLRIEIDTASLAALTRGPQLTLCRHVNVVDASLPALLHQRVGLRTRRVMMAELLADPGFDLIYPHARSVFIPRADGPAARAALTALTADLGDDLAVVIFPEGRLFRPERLRQSLARLADSDPERADRMAGLRHVLPPRPGGVLTLSTSRPPPTSSSSPTPDLTGSRLSEPLPAPRHSPTRSRSSHGASQEARSRTAFVTGSNWLDNEWLRVDQCVEEPGSCA